VVAAGQWEVEEADDVKVITYRPPVMRKIKLASQSFQLVSQFLLLLGRQLSQLQIRCTHVSYSNVFSISLFKKAHVITAID
jgi:hypothetical protein